MAATTTAEPRERPTGRRDPAPPPAVMAKSAGTRQCTFECCVPWANTVISHQQTPQITTGDISEHIKREWFSSSRAARGSARRVQVSPGTNNDPQWKKTMRSSHVLCVD
eukprot:Opistho-1_new@5406